MKRFTQRPFFTLHPVAVAGAFAAALSVIACGGDVVVDDDGRGASGQGGDGVGASGNVGNQGASGNVGNQGSGNAGNQGSGNVGNQGSGVGASGGSSPGDCHSCAQEVTCLTNGGSDPECFTPLCPRSAALFDALSGCICAFCAMECASACAGGSVDPNCQQCQLNAAQGPCNLEFGACANDV